MNKNKQHSSSNAKVPNVLVAISIASVLLVLFMLITYVAQVLHQADQKAELLSQYKDIYQTLTGSKSEQKTLLLLANNAEIRTGGGFIGTVGLITGKDGKVTTEGLSGVYEVENNKGCVDSSYQLPEYLKQIAGCASLRDSSNALDFPTNAQQAQHFYQLYTGQSVNNVVQITPNILEQLLDKLGPVYLKDYDLTVSKDNFRKTVQLEVETGQDKVDKKDPKSGILGNLANQVLQKLLSKDITELKDYLPLLQQMVLEKQLVLYSTNNDLQTNIKNVGAAGEIKQNNENFFLFTEANYGGNKSSPYIKNYVDMQQQLLPDGSSDVTVTIRSEHTSDYQVMYTDPNTNLANWLIGPSINYVSMGLPKGSILQSTDQRIGSYNRAEQNQLTVLSYNRIIQPKSTTSAMFRYHIPTSYVFSDRLVINSYIQKQLGGWPYELTYSLILPSDQYHLVAANQQSIQASQDGSHTIYYSGTIDKDTVFSFIYEK